MKSIVVSVLRGLSKNIFVQSIEFDVPSDCIIKEGYHNLSVVLSFIADMLEE